jgi:hypothetical protein
MDVTITASKRSRVLRRTLESFKENLLKDTECRAIINVDPVGLDEDPFECVKTCREFFGENVVYRIAAKPNFSQAFKWVWSQVKAEYVLHLEDDWLLVRKIDLKDMLRVLHSEPDLALLRLPQFCSGEKEMKNWNIFFPYNGVYFECPHDLKLSVGFCGHPSVIKKQFILTTYPYIDTKLNPEKQFHRGPKEIMDQVSKWRFGVYGKPNQPNAIADLGRKWMIEHKLRKRGNKAWFLEWEKETPHEIAK